jgi:hypothetical protein
MSEVNIDPEFIQDVIAVVEATSFEQHQLWRDWHQYPRYDNTLSFKQGCVGRIREIGGIDDRPIVICMFVNEWGGRRVLFYEATSTLVDHKMIADWFNGVLPDVPRVDADNFHRVVNRIKELNK